MTVDLSPLDVQCVNATLMMVAAGTAIGGAEILSMRQECTDHGLFSWKVARTSYPLILRSHAAGVLDMLCGYPQFLYAVMLQMLSALCILFRVFPSHVIYLLLPILFVHLLSMLRYSHASDGTDQMQTILLASLACYFATPDPVVRKAAIWFISLQTILAYCTSGIAKVLSKPWRQGTVLRSSLLLAPGNKTLYRWMPSNARVNQLLCVAVIAFECAFPLALTSPRNCLVILTFGLLLHLFNAVALGIPRFLFTFVAAYPLVFLSAMDLHSLLFPTH